MTPGSAESTRDDFVLDAKDLTRAGINGIRIALGITGAIALGLGILLLVWPDKTLEVVTAMLGAYFIAVGAIRLVTGLFGRQIPGGLRAMQIILGLVLVVAGVIALKNLAAATAALLLVTVAIIGIGWIIDGVIAIAELGAARSAGWAIAYGAISILGGIVVLLVPGWSAFWLVALTAAVLIILGVLGIVRAFTFGREALKTMAGSAPEPGGAAAF
jgi:uncharacterized membrane protein HdeD (DUF308 family)